MHILGSCGGEGNCPAGALRGSNSDVFLDSNTLNDSIKVYKAYRLPNKVVLINARPGKSSFIFVMNGLNQTHH